MREIDRARDAAIQDLAVTSANVAIDLARGVVRSEISADRQNQIVREALGQARRGSIQQELKASRNQWIPPTARKAEARHRDGCHGGASCARVCQGVPGRRVKPCRMR